jgi:hypothetical protein
MMEASKHLGLGIITRSLIFELKVSPKTTIKCLIHEILDEGKHLNCVKMGLLL